MTPGIISFRWTPTRVTLAQVAALIPPFLAAFALRGPAVFAVFAAALFTAIAWEIIFALIRRRPLTVHGASTALILAVMVPATLPLWQIAVAVSLGVVLGELIFGGRGFGFLNAAVASLAFLAFSFPGVTLLGGAPSIALASLPGAALLLVLGLVSWRSFIAAAVMLVMLAGVGALGGGTLAPVTSGAALLFGLVFLGCDPVSGGSTRAGQWLYGALLGGLIAVFAAGSGPAIPSNAVVFAVLLSSIFAPLLDYLVIEANMRRRRNKARRAHG